MFSPILSLVPSIHLVTKGIFCTIRHESSMISTCNAESPSMFDEDNAFSTFTMSIFEDTSILSLGPSLFKGPSLTAPLRLSTPFWGFFRPWNLACRSVVECFECYAFGEGLLDVVMSSSHFPFVAWGCLLIFVLMEISKLYGKNYVGDLVIYFVLAGMALLLLSFSSSFYVWVVYPSTCCMTFLHE